MARTGSAKEEHVLVIPATTLWSIGYFQGFSWDSQKYGEVIKMLDRGEFKRRIEVEEDPTYKQIIPYVILRNNAAVFRYRRGRLLDEARLLGNYSIGVGGHISASDVSLFTTSYKVAMQREVLEEIDLLAPYEDRVVGLINDDTNDVGKVHLGIVHVYDLQHPTVRAKEKSINEAAFCPVESLQNDIDKYENWSQICIRNIDKLLSV